MSIAAGYHHLKLDQRGLIMGLAHEGASLSHIAERCHTSVSTVSRELSRQFPKEVPLMVRGAVLGDSRAKAVLKG